MENYSSNSAPAPIALFAYKRVNELLCSLEALQANYMASESELYVFVDGPKSVEDRPKVEQVQLIAKQITGFKHVHLHFSNQNKGCAKSIIDGVSLVLRAHPTIIVVEDDIVTAPNFLNFTNQCLDYYASTPNVFSVGGYTFPLLRPRNYKDDVYFLGRVCAWGWGIWADRWFKTDWTISDFNTFINSATQRKAFNKYGGSDLVQTLRRTLAGKVDTWDILLGYNQFKQGGLTVYPVVSQTINIGFNGGEGMHANIFDRYKTILDKGEKRNFNLPATISANTFYSKKVHFKYSLSVRIYNKLKTLAGLR